MIDRDLIARVKRRLADEPTTPEPARIAALIREEAVVISDIGVLDVMRTLRDDTTGTGPLEALLADDTVTDICVNGPNCVYVDSGAGLERSAVRFESEAAVRRLASRLAASCGRRLDDAQPFCDGHITRDDGTLLRLSLIHI